MVFTKSKAFLFEPFERWIEGLKEERFRVSMGGIWGFGSKIEEEEEEDDSADIFRHQ